MIETSKILEARVTDLQGRMLAANVSFDDMQAFQRVADVMDNGRGSIDVDDLIALSFVTPDPLGTCERSA
ncbi:hypothetical protein RFM68_31130 [Mesorhizobium sp. MSK_1335]|uniref:Uncharacterized protein n=1 Tax=Mesorhizobium montanum TaxID=3072323 RepID=A0ABU4ZU46_9HYPH|nr:hypothetical protein [Mesorhizobium sp. MSK_1335]MDX8528932.1 hypothetical protein [Mesorhizobium sp. MSK_1335]